MDPLVRQLMGRCQITLTDGQRINTDIATVILDDNNEHPIALISTNDLTFPWCNITTHKKKTTTIQND